MLSSLPLVSIIIPSFNQGNFIEQTIKSILCQNYNNIEVIVVDGMSSDQTIEILNKYKNQISYIHEPDSGQSDAINKGLKLAKGEIISWLNSDDLYVNRNAISKIVQKFETNKNIDFIYGDFLEIDNLNNILRIYMRPAFSFNRLLRCGYISQPSTFFTKRAIQNHTIREDLHLTMDTELWLRMSSLGYKFLHVNELIAAERLHPSAKSVSLELEQMQEAKEVRMKHGATFDYMHSIMRFADKFVLYWFRIRGGFKYALFDSSQFNINKNGSFVRTISPFKIKQKLK